MNSQAFHFSQQNFRITPSVNSLQKKGPPKRHGESPLPMKFAYHLTEKWKGHARATLSPFTHISLAVKNDPRIVLFFLSLYAAPPP